MLVDSSREPVAVHWCPSRLQVALLRRELGVDPIQRAVPVRWELQYPSLRKVPVPVLVMVPEEDPIRPEQPVRSVPIHQELVRLQEREAERLQEREAVQNCWQELDLLVQQVRSHPGWC